MNFRPSASVTASTEECGLRFFYIVFKFLLEKKTFKNLSGLMSAITTKNKYKHPNIYNTLRTLCKNDISLFILQFIILFLYTNIQFLGSFCP